MRADAAPPSSNRGEREIEVPDDPAFHRRVWRVQRAGWLIMLLVVGAGLTGVFGSGPLSRTVAGDAPHALRIEYERFARADAAQAMRIQIPASAHSDGVYRLSIGRAFLDRARIDGVVPPPVLAEATAGEVVYVFAGTPTGAVATVHFTPRAMGLLSVELGAPGVSAITLRMLVYP